MAHSVELPSSTDQSKGVIPNSLPSLKTQLIIAMCPAVRHSWHSDCLRFRL